MTSNRLSTLRFIVIVVHIFLVEVGLNRSLHSAGIAINAFVQVDIKHLVPLVKAVLS